MMADFQDPIELIPKYIAEWEKGFEVVLGQKNSSDENFIKHPLKVYFINSQKKFQILPCL